MRTITANPELVAYCGLYCGACGAYLKERCPGCHGNEKATWCKVRRCCLERHFSSCAECTEFPNAMDCRKYNNFMSRMVGMLLRSDRAACIRQIREVGVGRHAEKMASTGRQTIRK